MGATRSRLKSGNVGSRTRREQMTWSKPLPPAENPHAAIPSGVLEQLGREQLPPTKEAYSRRLNELLAAYKLNGG